MTDTNSHEHPPTHHDFHWIDGPAQHSSYAVFVEATLDISAGINTCLQIIYASHLERAANQGADLDETVAPAIGEAEADRLLRLSIAAAGLLHNEAQRRVERFNHP